MKIRVYYHDTDCGEVVYYGRYLEYLEEARTEYLEDRGIFIREMLAQYDVMFVVARQEIDYKLPAFYGDVLSIETRVADASGVKVWLEYVLKNQDGKLVSNAKTLLVCVDKVFKPKSIPEDIKKKLLQRHAQ